ncbi:MAG TPA: tetratricopeptide repeat protein [Terriglobia bacterium]|nr:tetratricopeptide repeat protein [Terriglobia bacterium]
MTVSQGFYFRFFQLNLSSLQTTRCIDVRTGRTRAAGLVWRLLRAALVGAILLLVPLPSFAAPGPSYAEALAEFQAGKFHEASATLTGALQKTPANAASEILLARCYYEMGDWDNAILHAESAARLDPSNPESHVWLGQAYGRKAESQRSFALALKARRQFEQAVALGPTDLDARRDLMEFYLEAPWILGGSKDKARKQAAAIATLDPVEGTLARAQYDESTGDASSVQAEYRHVLDLKPDRVGPYLEVADNALARRDAPELNAAVSGAEKVNPTDPRIAYYRGVAHIMEGQRLPQAEHDLKSYAAHAPDRRDYPSHASALSWLGTLYERLGKPNLAMIEYEAALQLDPNFLTARKALVRLQGK